MNIFQAVYLVCDDLFAADITAVFNQDFCRFDDLFFAGNGYFVQLCTECRNKLGNVLQCYLRARDQVDQFTAVREWGSSQILQSRIYILGLYGIVFCKADDCIPLLSFLREQVVTILFCQSYLIGLFCQSHIGIVLSEQDAVFGTGGKHTVRFVYPFCDEVVDQYTDVGLVPAQDERLTAVTIDVGVDTSHESLSTCFFISGSSVDLSGKEQVADLFCLQVMM